MLFRSSSYRFAAAFAAFISLAAPHAGAQSKLAGAIPIWTQDTQMVRDQEAVYVRLAFRFPDAIRSATLTMRTSNRFTAYLNGASVLAGSGSGETEADVTRFARQGANLLAIQCNHTSSQPGITFALDATLADGRKARLLSSPESRASRVFAAGWQTSAFDDSKWPRAVRAPIAGFAGGGNSGGQKPVPPTTNQPPAPDRKPVATATPPLNLDTRRLVRVWDLTSGARAVIASNVPTSDVDYPLLMSSGVNLVQTDTDALSTNETQQNSWDFRRPDLDLKTAKAHGLSWSYFPHFAFPPKWYIDRGQYTHATTIEGNKVSAFSPWEPKFYEYAARGFERMAPRYRGKDNLSTLVVGIHGDYGEAGLLAGARMVDPKQREDWQKRFGDLNNQVAWWCGDPLAKASFRDAMVKNYADMDALNAAWKTKFKKPQDIVYPTSPQENSRRYWLDFVNWYLDSVGTMTETLLTTAQKQLPDSSLVVPMGFADENPHYGTDVSLIPKLVAKSKGEVRSTHGGYRPFAQNQATLMGRIASACKFYGVPFWTEATDLLTPAQTVSRIFTSASMGSKGHYDWVENIRTGREAYYRYNRHLRSDQPIVDVAMFYPSTFMRLKPDSGTPQTFAKGCAEIRDLLNYDIVDERMITDGALDKYRVLVMWEGTVIEAEALRHIKEWVERGGVLAGYDFGKVESVEGDKKWFGDLFGGRTRPAGSNVRYLPLNGEALPVRYRLSIPDPSSSMFLLGDWYEVEKTDAGQRRWTGAVADVRMPVNPARNYDIRIRASFPQEASKLKREVLINNQLLGSIAQSGETTFSIPPGALKGRELATISIRCETWQASGMMKGEMDKRPLGVAIEWIELDSSASPQNTAAPALPRGRFETSIDLKRLRSEWAQKIGSGWTVYYPATRAHLTGYYEVIRYLTYHLSDLDPTKKEAIAVDDAWDGVYATLFADRALYYNPMPSPITRTIVLSPSAFTSQGVKPPDNMTQTVTIDPEGISAIYFGTPPQEMLLQCEKFVDLGALKPSTGDSFSPGSGPTHVLLTRGSQITTRFQCDVPGKYKVMYHAVRRGNVAGAEVELDGKKLDGQPGVLLPGARTYVAGTVDLTQGVHTLTFRPRPGEDVRADFVILTTDTTVAGYGFGLK